jgi:hypothetical protein
LDTKKIAFCGALKKRFLGKRKDNFSWRTDKAIFLEEKKTIFHGAL